jgi:hypothetical protein
MTHQEELLEKHTSTMSEMEKLEFVKKQIVSAISQKKKLNKALEKEGSVDPFNSSRANRTTAYANSYKNHKVYTEIIDGLKMSVNKIL